MHSRPVSQRRLGLALAACVLAAVGAPEARRPATLANGRISVLFGDRGIVSIADVKIGRTFRLREDHFKVTIDGKTFDSATLDEPRQDVEKERLTYHWKSGNVQIDVSYELKPEWQFVSKQVSIVRAATPVFRVDEVQVFRARFAEPIAASFVPKSMRPNLGTGDYGISLRMADKRGLLAVVQNPFLATSVEADGFSVGYKPDIAWRSETGAFASDRGLLVPFRLSGRVLPARMVPEWSLGPSEAVPPGMDEAEIAAFTDLVRSFLLYRPSKPLNVMVGWCANDYQIDVATAEGRTEYKRLIDRAAELGARYVLYAPSNSAISRREESVDDWSWEHTLWLGLGQRLRAGRWDVRSGDIPPSVREMLDYAKSKDVKLLAYVYPVVPFAQNSEWLVASSNDPKRRYASLGVRAFQDWLIETLVTFHQRTGIGGFAFDHTFLAYEGTSRYAQWAGWRRVMEEVRRRIPDVVIDGRQAYHLYGPWSWLAGSYPHPTYNDEQPESFVPFPGLHFDRISADRQRYTAYRYRNYDFAPSEIVPGFITHQTPRLDDSGRMPERKTDDRGVVLLPFRERDWDYLGWRYSLLSSVATAGWNNVLNMIPARDLDEDRHFSDADRKWFRQWLDWTDRNRELLRHTRTIIGQPAMGRTDGTAAIAGDRGFIFLFNPNGRRLNAEFVLDATIGLAASGTFTLKEVYPVGGRLVGKPGAGVWAAGDRVSIEMDGGSAAVFELQPSGNPAGPVLFNAPGAVTVAGDALQITGVTGEVGTSQDLLVLLPQGVNVSNATVNGRSMPLATEGRVARIRVQFAGTLFRRYQPVAPPDPSFSGQRLSGSFTIPRRILDQLAARRKAWPIPWTPDDFRTTWLAPERLLLYVQMAEPDPSWSARLSIDGRTVELKKAYSAVRAAPRTFVGFYADLSLLDPDREYRFELELPALKPGQLQGVFFENVEPEYTEVIEEIADGKQW